MDSKRKSIVKSITYRITSSIATGILIFILTNEIYLSGIIVSYDLIIKIILYYLHERIWNRVK